MIANKPDEAVQRIHGARDEGNPADGLEHMSVCPRCGQSFDSRILHQVIYHEQPSHKPIKLHT